MITEESSPEWVTVKVTAIAPLEKVWDAWTQPKAITQWYIGHEDWHTPEAEVELAVGGKFRFLMAEKAQGGVSFEFTGTYSFIEQGKRIDYHIADGRKVTTTFQHRDGITQVKQEFQPESVHPVKFQKVGWQNILNNFKAFVEKG